MNRKSIGARKRVRSAPLFPTAALPKLAKRVQAPQPDRPHWFVRWVRSVGSSLLRFGRA